MAERGAAPVVGVIQARMSSRRLPGKVLTEIAGRTTLQMVTSRLAGSAELGSVVLATSSEASDDPVEQAAAELECELHRGPLDDVLGRFSEVIERTGAAAVVRVTADCPYVDPRIVDELVRLWRSGQADYVSNVIAPFSFPMGLNAEVIDSGALLTAAREAGDPADREHVTTFIRSRPERFSGAGLWLDPPLADAVLTLDTADDLQRLRRLAASVGHDPGLEELLTALGGDGRFRFSLEPPA